MGRKAIIMKDFDIDSLPQNTHIHFIGIGGISMSGLAQIMLKKGFTVSGSDSSRSSITDKLEAMGARIFLGHKSENIDGADIVVYTAAVANDNPELSEATKKGLIIFSRAEFLGLVMKYYKNNACIAGTHGKTTTTAMLAYALISAHSDPTVSIGGELDIIGGNIKVGSSDCFITEACEYKNSFLEFLPTVAVITNIDSDHLDFFGHLNVIIESFRKFAFLTKDKGIVVACGSDANVRKALDGTGLDVRYYGIGDGFDYCAKNIDFQKGYPSFEIWKDGKFLIDINLRVPGEHNILNAVAVIAVCDYWNIDLSFAKNGIESFHGAKRRFERKGELGGAVIMDDYAHHPTEIKATLKAAKPFVKNRLWCVFQPHTYSRTKLLWNDFCESFDNVDELIITHIYAAREKSDGVTKPENLARDIEKRGVKVRYIDDFSEIENVLKNELAPGDMAFTMGAGNVVEISDNLCKL